MTLTNLVCDEHSHDHRVDDTSQRAGRHCDSNQDAGVTRRQVQMVYLPTYTRDMSLASILITYRLLAE